MARFSETPGFILEEYFNNVLLSDDGELPDYTGVSGSGVCLVSANHVHITRDLTKFNFYAKSESSDYRKVKASVQSDGNDEYNRIILHKLLSPKIVPTDEVKRTVNESGYERITYNALDVDNNGYAYNVEQGDGIYIRKDHNFVTWLENNSDIYNGYVNNEKPYIYLGNGYQFHETLVKIYYYALKDGIRDALPYNNRTTKFSAFIDLIYDRLYSRLYNMQKDLLALIDPKEINEAFIDSLYSYYNVMPLLSDIDEYKERVFIDNLIYLLKKKGTYSSVYIIGKILSANTENELTIYDRWHQAFEDPAEGEEYPSPYEYFEDYPYINYYTGNFYPTNYESGFPEDVDYTMSTFSLEQINSVHFGIDASEYSKILSTHYKVEFDLNHNPMQDGYVLSKDMANDLHRLGESTRPINRVSHYHLLFDPIAAFTYGEVKMYDNPVYDANVYSTSNVYAKASHEDAYAHLQVLESNVGYITHNLDTRNVIVDVYNVSLEKIYPNSIRVVNENEISINFGNNPIDGAALILKGDHGETEEYFIEEGIVNHNLSNKYALSQFYNDSFKQVKPREVELLDQNKFRVVDIEGRAIASTTNYLHTQGVASNTGEINHDLGHNGVMISIFEKDGYKIIPENVVLDDYNKCTVYLSESIEGYGIIRTIGNVNTMPVLDNFNGSWNVKIGSGDNLENGDPREEGDIKKEDYRINADLSNFEAAEDGFHFKFKIPRLLEGYITEIGIFDKHDSLIFYSRVDNLYKHRDFIIEVDFLTEY